MYDEAFNNALTQEVAGALCIARTGVRYSDEDIQYMCDGLSDIAARYGLSPDGMQQILQTHEPALGMEEL